MNTNKLTFITSYMYHYVCPSPKMNEGFKLNVDCDQRPILINNNVKLRFHIPPSLSLSLSLSII